MLAPHSEPYVMDDTVSWPTSSPSSSTANGSEDPARAWADRTRTYSANVGGPPGVPGRGDVPSHRSSQSALRARRRIQAFASRRRSGRRTTDPPSVSSRSVTGHGLATVQPRAILWVMRRCTVLGLSVGVATRTDGAPDPRCTG